MLAETTQTVGRHEAVGWVLAAVVVVVLLYLAFRNPPGGKG